MEKNNDDILMKSRSAGAAVRDGLRLYTGNFRKILRCTWLVALVLSVAEGVYASHTLSMMATVMAVTSGRGPIDTSALPLTSSMLLALGFILSLLLSLLFFSCGFSMLAQHREEGSIPFRKSWFFVDRKMLLRTIVSWLFLLVVQLVVTAVAGGFMVYGALNQSLVALGTGCLVGIVLMLLLLPLVHVHMHYLTTRDTSLFHLLGTDFGQGLRRWGYIFVVLFVTLLIIVLVAFITTLPACILIIANMQSQMGVAQGDAMGMPSYISWLTTIVFAAASFIQAYAMMAILFPAYYMSGAIENKENEKKNTLY